MQVYGCSAMMCPNAVTCGPFFAIQRMEAWEGYNGGVFNYVASFGGLFAPLFFPYRVDIKVAVFSFVERFSRFEAGGLLAHFHTATKL